MPCRTTVISVNSGRCPGSTQPLGERMRATLTAVLLVLGRPTYSSMILGLFPAASMTIGWAIKRGMTQCASTRPEPSKGPCGKQAEEQTVERALQGQTPCASVPNRQWPQRCRVADKGGG